MKTTKQLEQQYLKNPNICPFCGSSNISADRPETDYNQVTINVDCDNCNKNWVEEFKMTGATFNADDMSD
jgi:transcription elongation factor Elf1